MNKNELLNELNLFLTNDYNIILIDGPWGSGKTYLLNEFIVSKKDTNLKFYYVSLHGLKNIDEINTRIFVQDNFNTKISSIVPSVINPFSINKSVEEVISFALKNKKYTPDKIVILDDFERYYNSDYDSFLSYLNTLVTCGAKIILVSNLKEFGTSELYAFDKYKEKLVDRIYKAELFDKKIIENKFKKYSKFIDEDILVKVKNNYRLIDKIVLFLDEIEVRLVKENICINNNKMRDFIYYVTSFISSYYESDKLYLNKECKRLSVKEESIVKANLDTEESLLDVNLICIEHLNSNLNKPNYKDDYMLFLGLYKAYMYSKYSELLDFIKEYFI